MPELIVKAASESGSADESVLLWERVSSSDLESDHFCQQLVERLGWAMIDAEQKEAIDGEPPAAS